MATKGRTKAQNRTRTNTRTPVTEQSGRAIKGSVAGRDALPGGPRPSLMTTEFAGLGGGEEVGASRGRVWPEVGGGPGWHPGTGVRDAAAWWPCCKSSGTLCVSAPALCAGGVGLACARGLANGCFEAGLLLPCATEARVTEQADRARAPVRASAAWDSDCRLSDENSVISGSAGGACPLCLWSCEAGPPWLPGSVGGGSSSFAVPSVCCCSWWWSGCCWVLKGTRIESRQPYIPEKNRSKKRRQN